MGRFKKIYRDAALVLLNTLLFFVALNLLLGVVYFVYDRYAERAARRQTAFFDQSGAPVDNGRRSSYQLDWFDYHAESEVGAEYVAGVLDDFYALRREGFVYQPWVQFSEPPFAGRHVSVVLDERGLPVRRTVNPPAEDSKPVVDIFVMGGSTTFGYHVGDAQTWPSQLSAVLNERAEAEGLNVRVRVANYGRAFYDTSQEAALVVDLLKSGHRPGLFVFMDGVNLGDREDVPALSEDIGRAMADAQNGSRNVVRPGVGRWLRRWVPAVRLAASVKSLWSREPEEGVRPETGGSASGRDEYVSYVLERFAQNRKIVRAVCREYGAETLFFIQPDPVYNYPVELYRRPPPPMFSSMRQDKILFHERVSRSPEVVYLGRLFDDFGVGRGRKAVLDDVHYTSAFNRFLAERVASHIDLTKIARRPSDYPAPPTGAKRRGLY